MSHLYDKPRIRISGDRAVLVEYGDAIDPAVNEKVRAMAALLKKGLPEGVEAVIPAYRNLSLIYNPLLASPEKLLSVLEGLEARLHEIEIPPPRVVEIPVLYGGEFGPDLGVVGEGHPLPALGMEPPAEEAGVVAGRNGGRHLETAMALNAVEVLLVAGPPVEQLLAHPVAELDRPGPADQPVLLPD